MRLITASQLAKNYFAEGSRPSKARVKTWVDDGLIEGKEIRGTLYVDEASFVRFYHAPDVARVEEEVTPKPKKISARTQRKIEELRKRWDME